MGTSTYAQTAVNCEEVFWISRLIRMSIPSGNEQKVSFVLARVLASELICR